MGALAVQRSRLILKCVRSFKSFKSYAAETLTLLVRSPLFSPPRRERCKRGSSFFLVAILRRCALCGECLHRLSRHAFAQDLIQQGFVDELRGTDRLVDFLRGTGGVNQELVAFDAIFAVRAEQLQ